MQPPFNLSASDFNILKSILTALDGNIKFFVFGSRVKNQNRKYSDLDLILKSTRPSPEQLKLDLKHALEDSDITIKVIIKKIINSRERFNISPFIVPSKEKNL